MFRIIICFLLILNISFAFAMNDPNPQQVKSIQCAPQLQICLNKILQIQELRELIISIQKNGPIQIIVNDDHSLSKKFGAFWDPMNRIITVNYSSYRSQGSLIGSIIFELHNASVNEQLKHLDYLAEHSQISRDLYVESIERLEYQNSLNASAIVRKGIQRGIFNESAHLPTYPTFEKHFEIQKQAGHSAYISKNYDLIISQMSCRPTPKSQKFFNHRNGCPYHNISG